MIGRVLGRLIKTVIYLLLLLIFLLVLGAILLISFVNPNHYKNQISQAFYDQTGRNLVITGDIHWAFFPSLGFKLGTVEVENPVGYPMDQDFVKLDSADLWLNPIGLFQKQIEVSTLSIDGFHVNLIQHSGGDNNWEFSSTESVTQSQSKIQPTTQPQHQANQISGVATSPAQDLNFTVCIDHLEIKNGDINFAGITPDRNWKISNLAISADHLNFGLNQAFPLDINLIWVKNQPNPLKINLNATMNIELMPEHLDIKNLNAKINESNLSGQMTLQNFKAPHLRVNLMLDQIDLADYINLQGARLLLGAMSLNADLTAAGLNQADLPSSLNGKIHADIAKLNLKGVDLAKMLEATGQVMQSLIQQQNIGSAFGGLKNALPEFSKTGQTRQISANNGQETDLGHFAYEAVVKNGVIDNHQLVLVGPTLQINGSGKVDLNQETVDYVLNLFSMPQDPNNLALKILIQGEFSDIRSGVDMKDLWDQLQKKALKSITSPSGVMNAPPVKQTIQDLTHSLKNNLKGLLGGE